MSRIWSFPCLTQAEAVPHFSPYLCVLYLYSGGMSLFHLEKKQQPPPKHGSLSGCADHQGMRPPFVTAPERGEVIFGYCDANNRFKFYLSQDPVGALLWVKKIDKGQARWAGLGE